MTIELIPSVFTGASKEGDFSWMLNQQQYDKALFVFNDNVGQSRSFLAERKAHRIDKSSDACRPGAGNGVIRPYQCDSPPRAIGIPTGPGFTQLSDGRTDIDNALACVSELLASGNYGKVVYSASSSDPDVLGHGTFAVPEDVLKYIPEALKKRVAAANGESTQRAQRHCRR